MSTTTTTRRSALRVQLVAALQSVIRPTDAGERRHKWNELEWVVESATNHFLQYFNRLEDGPERQEAYLNVIHTWEMSRALEALRRGMELKAACAYAVSWRYDAKALTPVDVWVDAVERRVQGDVIDTD